MIMARWLLSGTAIGGKREFSHSDAKCERCGILRPGHSIELREHAGLLQTSLSRRMKPTSFWPFGLHFQQGTRLLTAFASRAGSTTVSACELPFHALPCAGPRCR